MDGILELKKAVDSVGDNYFKPTLVNKYTGEVLPYKTPANYKSPDGVLNTNKDLCHTDDYVSIQQIYARLKNMHALSIADSEFAYNENNYTDNLEDETYSDFADVSEDVIDSNELVDMMTSDLYGNNGDKNGTDTLDAKGATEGATPEQGATEGAPDAF